MTKLQKDYNWTEEQIRNTMWIHMESALKRQSQERRTRFTKLIHGVLPTNAHLTKTGFDSSDRCPCCIHGRLDDQLHIFRCQHNGIASAQSLGLTSLRLRLVQLQTPSDLREMLLYMLTKWLQLEPHQTDNNIKWPNGGFFGPCSDRHKSHIFTTQKALGWSHLAHGLLVSGWAHVIEAHYRRNQLGKRFTGKRWSTNVIIAIWDIFDRQWKARLNIIHGVDSRASSLKEQNRVNEEIAQAYSHGRYEIQLDIRLKLFELRLEVLLEKTMSFRSAWLQTYTMARNHWIARTTADLDPGGG